ncbi:MAG TPA: methionyl-tRNA formyltransferase [Gaiellales bacterium]|nr:methionyl-tRNA formyltransferase [Gaiellales bacterium]
MRIAFFGTSAFAAGALERLVREDGIEIAVVVSQPDRPAGRGRKTATPPAVAAARELDVPVVQEERISDAPPNVEAGAVVAFGQILQPPLLDAYPLFNLHPSLLPRWRGAAPIERALMAGDRETATAVIELVAELDAGPIHGLERLPISPDDDAGTVAGRALDLGMPLLAAALRGETSGRAQEGEPTYAHRIEPGDRRVDWTRPAARIADQVRALSPHIGARAQLDDLPVTLWRATAAAGEGPAGAVATDGGALRIAAGEGFLDVHELQPAGKRRMTAAEFLRGRQRPPARAT